MADEPRQCQRCQAMIPTARLEALPRTRLCVQCSRETGGESMFLLTLKDGSLQKTGSDITWVEWVRREVPPKED